MDINKIIRETSHIYEKNILENIPSDDHFLHPIRELFANSLEAIKLKNKNNNFTDNLNNGVIKISLYKKRGFAGPQIDSIIIEDNGIGFNQENIKKFVSYMDSNKGYNNKGTGRFRALRRFDKLNIGSICTDVSAENNLQINFNYSKDNNPKDMYISDPTKKILKACKDTKTIISIYPEIDDLDYGNLTIEDLKDHLILNFLTEFILNLDSFPSIIIEEISNTFEKDPSYSKTSISIDDIPKIDKIEKLFIPYKKINNRKLKPVSTEEEFTIYAIKSEKVTSNQIILSSSSRAVESYELNIIKPQELIDNSGFLIIAKGDILDKSENLNDSRSEFTFKSKQDVQKIAKNNNPEFTSLESTYFLKEDLLDSINKNICKWFPIIEDKVIEKNHTVKDIKDKFLISDDVYDRVKNKIKIGASPESILKEMYTKSSEKIAEDDIALSKTISELETIDISDEEGIKRFEELTNNVVKKIPMQNRTALTQYITRRKMILELFEAQLNKKMNTEMQEKHFHNLIMKQHSSNTEDSSLWILNENFIYFDGQSEQQLCKLTNKGQKVFKDEFEKEEFELLRKFGRKRDERQLDVVLFPEEGKCVIIELKKPNVDVSKHLNQIQDYASLISSYSNDSFKFTQFYGYLIGENFTNYDVRRSEPEFKESSCGTYLFRPKREVVPEEHTGRNSSHIYTEVLRYSELLKRAKIRNSIFEKKLGFIKKESN
ncbi:MAG: ATP-binding protein [Proteobacteria bacterium]|nr:ATP-binding protein [Pseudomonadota bacterium]